MLKGIYEIGGLGLNNLLNGAQIIAYGDFDNNKYTDIVTLDDSLRTLTIWLYSHDSYSFTQLVTITRSNTVAAVIPGDFNYDGKTDLLIVTQTSQTPVTTNLEYFFRTDDAPYFGASSNEPNLQKSISGSSVHPFVFDIDNDKLLDVMYEEGGVRKVHSIDTTEMKIVEKSFSDYVSDAGACKSYNDVSSFTIYTPHSNSAVDFNGDCAADLLITSKDGTGRLIFEIWLMNPDDGKFCLVDVEPITSPISPVSIGDINGDGRLDLVWAVVPAEATQSMSLVVLYNSFPGDSSNPCKLQDTAMRSPFTNAAAFNSMESISGYSKVVSFSEGYSATTRLFTLDSTHRPSRIRIGDINIDGYADLLMVLYDPENNAGNYGQVTLVINQEGGITFDTKSRSSSNDGYYTILDDDALTNAGDASITVLPALYASFFDFDEFGRLGMWIITQSKTDPATIPIGIFNFVESENFMLKTLGLSGYNVGDEDDIAPKLGNIYYGASMECAVTDVLGDTRLAKGHQLAQSGYTPLDLPYSFIGLGRTNNYVENFAVGISAKKDAAGLQQSTWTPIIPNSQLIVNPINSTAWVLDVYVNPTSDTLLIVFTTVVILILMGTYILYLKAQEEKEDREKRDPYSMFRKF
jgi:integrin alpha FG-GAP repeat containing protein 1